jgi:hypothetical protein
MAGVTSQLLRRKPIAALMANEGTEHFLRRVLGAGGLVMLANVDAWPNAAPLHAARGFGHSRLRQA